MDRFLLGGFCGIALSFIFSIAHNALLNNPVTIEQLNEFEAKCVEEFNLSLCQIIKEYSEAVCLPAELTRSQCFKVIEKVMK